MSAIVPSYLAKIHRAPNLTSKRWTKRSRRTARGCRTALKRRSRESRNARHSRRKASAFASTVLVSDARRLPVFGKGVESMIVRFRWANGKEQVGLGLQQANASFFTTGAEIKFPAEATDMKVKGRPVINVEVGQNSAGTMRFLEIPLELWRTAAMIKERIIPGLAP